MVQAITDMDADVITLEVAAVGTRSEPSLAEQVELASHALTNISVRSLTVLEGRSACRSSGLWWCSRSGGR